MSQPTGSTRADDLSVSHGPGPATSSATRTDASVGELIGQLTEQVSHLVRDEVALAKVELTEKGKKAGLGLGMFSGAGLLAFFGFGALVTTAILALALVVSAWLAALIVGVVLFLVAGALALVGRKEFQQVTPALPQATLDSVKQDVDAVKEGFQR